MTSSRNSSRARNQDEYRQLQDELTLPTMMKIIAHKQWETNERNNVFHNMSKFKKYVNLAVHAVLSATIIKKLWRI